VADICIYNRYTKNQEIEKVYGEKAVELAYDSKLAKAIGPLVASRSLSRLYGSSQDTISSGKKVPKFIKKFNIKIDDYLPGSLEHEPIEKSYKTFNEFFIRKFKAGLRPFPSELDSMGAFAEARYFGHEAISESTTIPVKGKFLSAAQLLGNVKNAEVFEGGPLLLARLCPVDYHRYHYCDSGKTLEAYRVKGDFHSVNPLALKLKQNIFIKNERRISIIQTENFGKLAYIEVGATMVGKIIQSADESQRFERGQEKGYFLFGGSTVIVLGEPNAWKPSADILVNTKNSLETYVHLGDAIALKNNS
tara:strand:- start:1507 stop:2424 length:918 start_codon:yes stop_codon:yes gene_type:complete